MLKTLKLASIALLTTATGLMAAPAAGKAAGISPSNVGVMLHRAKKKLLNLMQETAYE